MRFYRPVPGCHSDHQANSIKALELGLDKNVRLLRRLMLRIWSLWCWGLCYSPFWCYSQKCLSVLFGNKKFTVLEQIVEGLLDTFRMSGGSLFHWFGPDTEKPRRPNLSVSARGTTRSPWSVERSRGRCTSVLTELQISCKYIGADPLTQFRTGFPPQINLPLMGDYLPLINASWKINLQGKYRP